MARPTKEQEIAIQKRNMDIYKMSKKYPQTYLVIYFDLSKGTISKIIKEVEERLEEEDN